LRKDDCVEEAANPWLSGSASWLPLMTQIDHERKQHVIVAKTSGAEKIDRRNKIVLHQL
jgi:hypothetical protein